MGENILSIHNLNVSFKIRDDSLHALHGIHLEIQRGEILSVVGESGSGKTVLVKTIMGLLDKNGSIDSGSIIYDMSTKEAVRGENSEKFMGYFKAFDLVSIKKEQEWLKIRGREIAMVLQDSMTSLNPLITIGEQIKEAVVLHQKQRGGKAKDIVLKILGEVGIREPDQRYSQYPHELSGGMRQRVVIAMAIVCNPKILICDEPTTSLDVSIQAEILDLLLELKKKYELTVIFITHDFGVVARIADRVAVMYDGSVVEIGTCEEIFYHSKHQYTKTLLSATKRLGCNEKRLYSYINYEPKKADKILLEVKDLSICYGKGRIKYNAVKRVNFNLRKGETFGIVGESGSGKTTIGRAIMRMIETSSGEIRYKGTKINSRVKKELGNTIKREIQMIFQDPMASLNERSKVEYIIAEGIYHRKKIEKQFNERELVYKTLLDVGLLKEHADRFPHEFSGGQRQRIGIARAYIMKPELIIADEPISSLDMSIRVQILSLLDRIQKEIGITYLFIAHDLSVMRYITDRIAVIYKGEFVELSNTSELFRNPLHPYTKSLLSAMPIPDPRLEKKRVLVPYQSNIHDYSIHKPMWVEIKKEHYVLGNIYEIAEYKKKL